MGDQELEVGKQELIKEVKEKLRKKLWKTYQTRIITSERLEKKDKFYHKINVYYSLLIVIFSLFDVFGKEINIFGIKIAEKNLTFIILILSICSAIFAMFISSKGYKERSLNMKMHYIALKDLYYDLTLFEDNKEQIKQVQTTYSNLLKTVENHSKYDYTEFRAANYSKNGNRGDKKINDFDYGKPSEYETIRLTFHKFKQKFFYPALLWAAPFLFIYTLKLLTNIFD